MVEKRVLDLGCGINPQKDANYCVDFVKTDYTTHVVDIDNHKLPFKSEFFDKIYAIDVLEHLNNVEHVMREIYRCLKPSGIVIIQVPYFRSPLSINPLHRTEWAYDSFNYWTERNGRMILKSSPFFRMIRRSFIFDPSMNKYIKRVCEFYIKRNFYFYQNIISVFFPARGLEVVLTKE